MDDKTFDEFTVHLISSASMNIFRTNTLAKFKNHFSDEINLEGDWRVALTEINFPANLYNVSDTVLRVHHQPPPKTDPEVIHKERPDFSKKKKTDYTSPIIKIEKGFYPDVEVLLEKIRKICTINFEYQIDDLTGLLTITFEKFEEGITFPNGQIPGILGFEGVPDAGGIHIGYKMNTMSNHSSRSFTADYPVDLAAGTELMFIYIDLIEYQYLGDTKAPLLRIIDTNRRMKNGTVCHIEPNHRKVFSNLQYKKLLTKNIQTAEVQLRTETGHLVPFTGTGKVVVALNFKKFN